MDPSPGYHESPIRVNAIAKPTLETIQALHQYWRNAEDEGYLERHWPGKDDHDAWIPIIRNLLAPFFPQLANVEITYFAAGTFHRLYRVTDTNSAGTYLFRVAIPVDPVFKTESEVATMEYVRRYMSMPIPRVLAFSSSDDNELGHEWTLMEMLPGVSVRSIWAKMPFDAKVGLFTELAGYMNELLALRFSKLGNIYFAEVAGKLFPQEASPNRPANGTDTTDIGISPNGGFVIGRIVSHEFFFDKRVHLDTSRGPFRTTREWINARIDLLGKRIRSLSVDPGMAYYCDNDRELEKNWDRVNTIFQQLVQLVPRLVPTENGPEDVGVLWHDDLSEHNLLVDPQTFKLTGIVDWESVSIVPAYETYDGLPACLSDRDNKPAPLVLIERELSDGYIYDVETKKLRNELEQQRLREVYRSHVKRLYNVTSEETQKGIEGKQALSRQLEIGSFQYRPWATESWIANNGFFTNTKINGVTNGANGANGTDTRGELQNESVAV